MMDWRAVHNARGALLAGVSKADVEKTDLLTST